MTDKKTHGVILMTALVPTIGHQFLVSFAETFCDEVTVIISTRTFEPTDFRFRADAIDASYSVKFVNHADDTAPQYPKTKEEWDYWKRVVENARPYGTGKYTHFFASEEYGQTMADLLGLEFIPVDIARSTFPVKGTFVRKAIITKEGWGALSKDARYILHKDVVLFGQESTGKTTMARNLSVFLNGTFVHEWARPYLEHVGPELTPEKMLNITKGQHSLETSVYDDWETKHFTFFDTDLLSTLGYYRLLDWKHDLCKALCEDYQYMDKERIYIVMNDKIPFVPDPLRYGGDKRETDRQFWIDILDEYGMNYHVLEAENYDDSLREIRELILRPLLAIEEFERE